MNTAEQIQVAADIIRAEMARQGSIVSEAAAMSAARKLHRAWFDHVEPQDLPPGAIAQRFRERYER